MVILIILLVFLKKMLNRLISFFQQKDVFSCENLLYYIRAVRFVSAFYISIRKKRALVGEPLWPLSYSI